MRNFLNHMTSTLENVLLEPPQHLAKQKMHLYCITILPI